MKNANQILAAACMAVLAFLLQALGGWDAALGTLFSLMALDVLTGVAVSLMRRSARTRGGFLSRSFFLGVSRKLLMVLMVILGTALDSLLRSQVCRLGVIGFYAANEALSVVENAALAGVPFPKGLLQALERYRARQDGESAEKEPE